MNLRISDDAERIIRSQVQSGHFASENEVVEEALRLLSRLKSHHSSAERPLTEEEFGRQLLAVGLLSELPDTRGDVDDPDDAPVRIQGEPLSQTVLRERR